MRRAAFGPPFRLENVAAAGRPALLTSYFFLLPLGGRASSPSEPLSRPRSGRTANFSLVTIHFSLRPQAARLPAAPHSLSFPPARAICPCSQSPSAPPLGARAASPCPSLSTFRPRSGRTAIVHCALCILHFLRPSRPRSGRTSHLSLVTRHLSLRPQAAGRYIPSLRPESTVEMDAALR